MVPTINVVEVQRALRAADYPQTRAELLHSARQRKAGDPVLAMLAQLPRRTYEAPAEVWQTLVRVEKDKSSGP